MSSHNMFAAITFALGRRERTIVLDGWFLGVLTLLLPCVAGCYLGATVYLVWHDQLLAALMTRQSEMQYAHEDRVAALKAQLDAETTRGDADRLTLETGLRDLALKSERLERRAATVDDLVARLMPARTSQPMQAPSSAPSVFPGDKALPASAPLRPSGMRGEDHADTLFDRSDAEHADADTLVMARTASVARDFDRLADRQVRVIGALAAPTMRAVERMTAALLKTGLSVDRRRGPDEVGGPFVPLPAGTHDFEQTAALLRDATVEHARLTALVGRVPLRRPMAGPLDVTSTFGARLDPFLGRPAMHTGLDLREAWGEAVTATAGGTVTIAGADGGYGNLVELDHGNGLRTRYAHLGAISVTVNQRVAAGTVVGHIGATGRATGPHLHYEVRIDGEPVDPTRFLRAGADLFPG